MTQYFEGPQGRRIAYNRLDGQGPGIVFLGGFRSDMQGTKALWLEEWARERGRAFLRLDYSGHGESSGAFEDGVIGDWFADAMAAIQGLTTGQQVLVGSSMGGWIALLVARAIPERLAGLVTIAAAPDFTQRGCEAGFSEAERARMQQEGRVEQACDYGGDAYVITRRLIEDGRDHLVMNQPLPLPFPVRFLQGTEDRDVPMAWALELLAHGSGGDLRLTLVKGADHRFSTPDCLALIGEAVAEVTARAV
ncbi:alpha/beta hydrolase [Paracoccus sp. (in: a-proteobacteria)]|uniref:alpha/beta fold hydrolase n=1 Tax=Paracoccus sp. TaxID=267 RepID=UPI00321FD9BD